MILESNQKDFGPKVSVQGVLRFDHCQIIAGGNNAAVEHNQIVFAWGKNHALLAARGKKEERCATHTLETAK